MSTSPDLLCTVRKSDMKAAVALALLTVGAVLLECDSLIPIGDENLDWSVWESWSPCSASCNKGSQTRYRHCGPAHRMIQEAPLSQEDTFQLPVKSCWGSSTAIQDCSIQPCSGWAEWSAWSSCDNSCTTKTRTRTCWESSCPGSNNETSVCRRCMKPFSEKYTARCGFLSWRRCTRYRTAYTQGCC